MKYYNFEELNVFSETDCDMVFKRNKFQASKFGKVDTYCCIKFIKGNATGDELKVYSQKMFTLANKHRTGTPLGFGASLVVYPLLITDNITLELSQFIKIYCPKHFAAAEFPSVLDLSTGIVYYYEYTPLWGYAYYNGYRRESYALFSPLSWEQVSKAHSKII